MDAIIFYIHIGALLLAGCGVLYADKIGFAWVRGHHLTLPVSSLRRVHYLIWSALGLLILSGALLFWPMREYLLHDMTFYVKMAFVLGLIVNSFFIDRLMHIATHTAYDDLPKNVRTTLIVSGAASFICWVGAPATALFLFG